MAYDFRGKWALVTGAGREGRVGAKIAEYFAREGSNVYLHYRSDRDKAEKVRERVLRAGSHYPVEVELIQGELSDPNDVKRIFREISPDIVVNNAAIFRPPVKTSVDQSIDAFLDGETTNVNEFLKANATSSYLVAMASIHGMLRKKDGYVFFIGDASIERGGNYPETPSYVLSKSYVSHVVRNLAALYGKNGIRFHAVFNGPIDPPQGASQHAVDHIAGEINLPYEDASDWIGSDAVAEEIIHLVKSRKQQASISFVDGGRVWPIGKSEHQ